MDERFFMYYEETDLCFRMLGAGWPDARSIGAALIDPVEPIVVTRLFEELT